MLLWLDGAQNRAGKPNENFSRELMELFTLGIGHYTERMCARGPAPSPAGPSCRNMHPSVAHHGISCLALMTMGQQDLSRPYRQPGRRRCDEYPVPPIPPPAPFWRASCSPSSPTITPTLEHASRLSIPTTAAITI